mmetsp:Transcript_32337/g.52242  ORF Transcript_32337/g.52242 Transcript_32337/m.52242 type:complete len:351 (-) Transcript_32337:216-1268(-)|eukprot:CAMPEP_0184645388 /NCGR_PEP_ID=MMETSP0308-20130426/1846_1 /TAXON_ID=38269 /ORGANISM="Gloeochaete witrockiana, Strain SAG 46.84" /LENGTH=350 /DNA_ID=CAMNT_0027074315 /DNA_START=174 /DNA_END=1226 /DNA_ORIENTATION=-
MALQEGEKVHAWAAFGPKQELKPFEYVPRLLGDSEVEIKISHCGICGSDLHTMNSGWGPTNYPCVVGHEIVGLITRTGKAVRDFRVGDRVGVGAEVYACLEKTCSACSKGVDNLCPKLVWTYNSKYSDGQPAYGGYASHVRVAASHAFKIPDSIKSEYAAPLLCAGVTVYAPLKRHGVGKGIKCGIVGIGGLGHLAIQFAAALGAEVTAISHSENKRAECFKLGATSFLNVDDNEAVKKASTSLDVILCTSFATAKEMDTLLGLVTYNGKFVIVGISEEKLQIAPFSIIMAQVSIVGSLIGSVGEIKEMLEFAAKHNVLPIIEKYKMSECNKGVERVESGKVRYRVVLEN